MYELFCNFNDFFFLGISVSEVYSMDFFSSFDFIGLVKIGKRKRKVFVVLEDSLIFIFGGGWSRVCLGYGCLFYC